MIDRKYLFWGVIALVAVIALVLLLSPGAAGVYSLFWSESAFQRLFYEDIQLGDSLSRLLATLFSVVYAFAAASLAGWAILRVLSRRASRKETIGTLAGYIFIFSIFPAVHLAADAWANPGACFNQRTGEPTKWYVVETDGAITLYDSGGFDKLGRQKLSATREACAAFERVRNGERPQEVSATPQTQFFDPATGAPTIWYARDGSGSVHLFNGPGFDPGTGVVLAPITQAVVVEVTAAVAASVYEASASAAVASASSMSEASAAAEASKTSAEAEAIEIARQASAEAGEQLARAFQTDAFPEGIVLVGAVGQDRAVSVTSQLASIISVALSTQNVSSAPWPVTISGAYAEKIERGDLSELVGSRLGAKLRAGLLLSTQTTCRDAQSVQGVRSCTVSATASFVRAGGRVGVVRDYVETGAGVTDSVATMEAIRRIVELHPNLVGDLLG